MVSNLRNRKMTPQQEERRMRLLGAFGKALRAAEEYRGYTTPSEREAHESGVRWLAATNESFAGDERMHDAHMLALFKEYGLRETFNDNGIRTLGEFLSKPISRIDRICDQGGKKLPFVLKSLHAKYGEEHYRASIPQQAWHSIVDVSSDPSGKKEETQENQAST